jgi:hypothetical protein
LLTRPSLRDEIDCELASRSLREFVCQAWPIVEPSTPFVPGWHIDTIQAPATAIYIELQNVVEYQEDTTDLSKWGTNPNITQGSIGKGGVGCAGVPLVGYGDIVSVNGQPASTTGS